MGTHLAASVRGADCVPMPVRTYHGGKVRPSMSNVWWQTPTSALAALLKLSADERDKHGKANGEGEGPFHLWGC